MGLFSRPRPILLTSLWICTIAGTVLAEPLQDTEPASTVSRPLSFTKTIKPTTPEQHNTSDKLLPLEVVINGSKNGVWLLLERDGIMYAPFDAFEEWRVQLPPEAEPIDFKLYDQTYWPLSAVPGYKMKLDFASQSAELLFSPEVFAATRLTQEKSKKPPISPVLPSLFLNYDLNYSTTSPKDATTTKELGALMEIGASGELGILTSSHAGRNLNRDGNSITPHGWVRLETTFTRDFPDENRTLRVGDSVTRAGMWGRNVYFGGLQYGSNFALTPGFISQPVPALTGMSTAPSTVEMYINDVLRQVSTVPTGPFAIDNLPQLTGSGDVRMVVRDVLGRETVIEQSFFISSDLLATGLDDWSVEAGSVRQDIGLASNHYGPGFASGTWRHGYTNTLTLEGRTEISGQLRTLGFGGVSALPQQMLGKASMAASNGMGMSGNLWLLGLEHQRLRSSMSFQIQGATSGFRQLGQPETILPAKLQLAGNWSYATENIGSFGIGMARLDRFDGTNISTVSCNYSTRIGEGNSLNLTASRALSGTNGTSIGLFLAIPIDSRRVVSASSNSHDGQHDFFVSAMQNPSHDDHLGWRALAGRQQNQSRAEGGVYYTGRYGKLTGDASVSPGQNALRLGANGGLVLTDSTLFATRRLDQSFAIAEVPGYADIGIGLGSNMLSRTDENGKALIPRLIPYQNNAIRLNPDELPISAEVSNIEQNAVPAWRSAVKVTFPVRGGRGALLKIMLDDGNAAPAGAKVHIEGDDEEFYVARRGEAFVTGLQPDSRILLDWNGQRCRLDVTLPPENPDEIPRVGPLLCTGVSR